MPYIITTSQPITKPIVGGTYLCPMSRRAVATLDEAREAAHSATLRAERTSGVKFSGVRDYLPIRDLVDEQGGTVGPLPNGTVIEVERIEWTTLLTGWKHAVDDHAAILVAYNEAQTTA